MSDKSISNERNRKWGKFKLVYGKIGLEAEKDDTWSYDRGGTRCQVQMKVVAISRQEVTMLQSH